MSLWWYRRIRKISIGAASILISATLYLGCEKLDPERTVKIQTDSAYSETSSSCVVTGKLLDVGQSGIVEVGFCWSTNDRPTVWAPHSNLGHMVNPGSFSDTLTGLFNDTEYFFRAYARDTNDVYYGDIITFITQNSCPASISFKRFSDITLTTVMANAEINDEGCSPITARGFCWDTEEHPTLYHNMTVEGGGVGSFTSKIS
jgi:hypothetical protein